MNIVNSQILELLADKLDGLLLDFHTEHPYIVSGGAVANSLLNLLHDETLPINDVDVFVFDNLGDVGTDVELNLSYQDSVIFDFLNFGIKVSGDFIQTISVTTKLTLPYNIQAQYLLRTFPLNCTQIFYDPKTRQFNYTPAFLEFLKTRKIKLNPITKDTSSALCKALKKHEEGVGHLSSNYIRYIFSETVVYPPVPKLMPYWEKLKQYPFIESWGEYLVFTKFEPPSVTTSGPLVIDHSELRIAYFNERNYYNDRLNKQAEKAMLGNPIFYIMTTIIDPAYFRKPTNPQPVTKHYLEILIRTILLTDANEVIRLIHFINQQSSYYTDHVLLSNMLRWIHLGVTETIKLANEGWNAELKPTNYTFEINTYADLAKCNGWDHMFNLLPTQNIIGVKRNCVKKDGKMIKGELIYKEDPKLYFFIRWVL